MKANILLQWQFGLFLLVLLLGGFEMAQAQGPTVDPSFIPAGAYKPAAVRQALKQTDGKYLVLSDAVRVAGSPSTGLVRLEAASNLPDQAFQANVSGLAGACSFLTLLPNGQIILISDGALTLGSVTRQRLLRLNADGTPDAGFDAGSGAGFSNFTYVLGQPDGKVLVAGDFVQFNGQTAGGLVRLNANGSLDAAFQAALGTGPAPGASSLALQADGKILVTGGFSTINGIARRAVARLLPTGAVDASFNAPVPSTVVGLSSVTVQPDGKILVVGNPVTGWQALMRLETSGAVDASFQNGTGFSQLGSWFIPVLQVQPDGKILVQNHSSTYNGTTISQLVRLLPNGGLDPGFANATAVPGDISLNMTQLLPTGQVLVATTAPTHFGPSGSPATGIALLNSDGSRDPAFAPVLQSPALVRTVVQQPDGKYVVGGNFTEIGGLAAGYVARLNTDGTADASFTAAAQASDEVMALALQPDGKVLVGGSFERLAGSARVSLGRLLPGGALDAGFAPNFVPTVFGQSNVRLIALQNDGRILINGLLTEAGTPLSISTKLLCLNSVTGQRDTSFPASYNVNTLLVQPDGNIVVAAANAVNGSQYPIIRLLPSGTPDPSFVLTSTTGTTPNFITQLARDATGRLYAAGGLTTFGSLPAADIVRLLPNGTPDPSFAYGRISSDVFLALAVQPNGRLLVGGLVASGGAYRGTVRLLANGAPDASYTPASGPAIAVYCLLVQPDGAIVAAGDFTTVTGLPISSLVRLLDANVLSVNNQRLAARTQAWPVPAHGALHLALDAASRPQRVELLDGLGRVALSRITSQSELTLDTSPLPAGVYVLRVQYASGPVARRVVVE